MKTFNEIEVDDIVRNVIKETIHGFMEFIEKDVNVVNKESGDIIVNAQLDMMNKLDQMSMLKQYIYPRMEKHGIKFTDNVLHEWDRNNEADGRKP